jgi:hypothetical protein
MNQLIPFLATPHLPALIAAGGRTRLSLLSEILRGYHP